MAPETQTILVVDDEPMVREVLCQYLSHAGFDVRDAADGDAAITEIERADPDLVLLDVMLPGRSGLSVLEFIRERSDRPVILLTALGEERDRVAGLELGADDYVVKPFSPREVTARVRSVLRRTAPTTTIELARFGDVAVDLARHEVHRGGEPVDLTRLEFELLTYFIRNPSQVLDRDRLLSAVWGSSSEWQDPSTVTVHVRRLRQKLEGDPSQPRHILTVYGVGYRFEAA